MTAGTTVRSRGLAARDGRARAVLPASLRAAGFWALTAGFAPALRAGFVRAAATALLAAAFLAGAFLAAAFLAGVFLAAGMADINQGRLGCSLE